MDYSHDTFLSMIKDMKNYWQNPAMNYKNSFIPDRLYKYWSFASSNIDKNLQSLIDGKIWMPVAQTLNDPFEFQMLTDEMTETEHYMFRFDVLGRNSVLSLAENPKNYLMWSHYGNAHMGVCLEFAVENKFRCYPITYVKSQIDVTEDIKKWFEVKTSVLEKIMQGVDLSFTEHEIVERINRIMFYKHDIWKYEKEYRIIGRKGYDEKENDVRMAKGYLATLSDMGLKLKRIILGFNCDIMDKAKVIRYVNQKKHELILEKLLETDFKNDVVDIRMMLAEMEEFVTLAQVKRKGNSLELEIVDMQHHNYQYSI